MKPFIIFIHEWIFEGTVDASNEILYNTYIKHTQPLLYIFFVGLQQSQKNIYKTQTHHNRQI